MKLLMRTIGLTLLLVAGLTCLAAGNPPDEHLKFKGTIRHIQLEGGFWGIVADDLKKYEPTNLPEEYKQEGLRVQVEGFAVPRIGFHMWGIMMEITSIQPEGGGLAVKDGLAGEEPVRYRLVSAEQGIATYVDVSSIRFFHQPDGIKVAEVMVKRVVDDKGRARLIDGRNGMGEPVAGFERLDYYVQQVWLKLEDPAYPDGVLPLRKLGRETYFDASGHVIHTAAWGERWQGGKWFTLPGFEEVVNLVRQMEKERN